MSFMDKVMEALAITYTTADKAKRVEAEQYLASQESTPGFLEEICRVLEKPELQGGLESQRDGRKALLNYLHKYVGRLWQYNRSGTDTALKSSVLDNLVKLLLGRLSHEDKLEVVGALAAALVADSDIHKYADNFVVRAQHALKSRHLMVACYLLYSVLLSTKILNTTVVIYKSVLPQLIEQLMEVIGQLPQLLNSSTNAILLQQLMTTLDMCWRVITAEVRLLEFDKFKSTCIHLVRNERLFEALVLTLRLAPDSHVGQLILLHDDKLIAKLNKSRVLAAESLLLILMGIRNSKFKLAELHHIVSIYAQLLPVLVQRLPIEIQLRRKIQSQCAEHQFDYPQALLTTYMQIAGVAARHPEHCDFFIQYREHLFCNVILAMNLPNEEFRSLMMEKPMDYIRSLIDRCDRQNDSNPRSGAARLFEALCDKIDGSVSYFAEIILAFIKWGLQQPQQLPEGTFKQAILESQFFRTTSWSDKLETGFLLMAEMSYIVDPRPDLILQMEQLLNESIDRLIRHPNPYVTVSFIVFYEYYADTFYIHEKDVHPTLRKFLTWIIELSRLTELPFCSLREELYSTLSEVLTDPNVTSRFSEHMFACIEQLLPNLLLSQSHELMGMLTDLLLMYGKKLSTDRQKLLSVIETISIAVYSESQPASQRTILVQKYLQMLRALASSNEYFPYLEEICLALKPCLPLLNNKNSFHDTIISVVNTCVRSTKQLRPELTVLLQSADKLIQWNSHSLQRLFETINLACIYSQPTDTYVIQRAFELSFRCMTLISQEQTIPNDLLQGCLLMHTFLFYHHRSLTPPIKLQLLQAILNLIDTQHVVLEPQLYSKYLLVLLQLLNFDFPQTTQDLHQLHRLDDVLALLFDNARHYLFENYDSKMFAINVSQILERRWLELNPQILLKMFGGLVTVIRNLYNIESRNKRQQQRFEDESPTESSGDDDDQKSNKDAPEDLFETYKATMRVFVSPYKQMDEFALLHRLMQSLRNNHQANQTLVECADKLPAELREFLTKTALSVQKVHSDGGLQARRIVRVKRS